MTEERCNRIEQIYQERMLWETIWEYMYRYYAPERANIQHRFQPNDIYRDIYDSTPINAAENLANTLLAGLVPPWVKWANLVPGPLVPESRRDSLLKSLETVNNLLFVYINQSGLTRAAQPAILDAVIGGTGCVKVNPRINGKGFVVSHVPLEYLGLLEDPDGNIQNVYEKRKIKGRTILLKEAWKEKLPQKLLRELEGNGEYEVISGCERISDTGTMQFEYFDILKAGDYYELDTKKMRRNPYIAFRYSKISDSPYGRGPGIVNFSDTRTLNKSKEFILKSAAFSMLGVWIARADGLLNPYTTRLVPGEIIHVNDTSTASPSLRRADGDNNGFLIGQQLIADLKDAIKTGFYTNRFANEPSDRATAVEIVARAQALSQAMGSTYARLVDEWLLPLVSQFVEILKEQNILPNQDDLKIGNDIIDVVFMASLAQAQRMQDVQNIVELITIAAQFGQIDRAAINIIDMPTAVSKIAEQRSVPREILNSIDEAKQIRDQQNEALAARIVMENQNAAQGQARA